MAQVKPIYRGKTHTLRQALDLIKKEALCAEDVETMVEGGGICSKRGLEMLASGRDDAAPTLHALAVTSQSLFERVRDHLEGLTGEQWDEYDRSGLIEKIGHAAEECVRLRQWTMPPRVHSGPVVYHA